MRKVLLLFIISFFSVCYGQIFRGVEALSPYQKDLGLLDDYLKSSPREFKRQLKKLKIIQSTKGEKTLEAILYVYQGSNHYYLNAMDSAAFYFDKAMELSSQIGEEQIFRTASIRRIFTDDYTKTKYQMAKEMEAIYIDSYNKKDTINMLYSLNGLGIFYGDIDSVSLSLNIFYEALKLADMSRNLYEKGFILNNLGLIKHNLGALDSAYSDFNQCLEIGNELGNVGLISVGHQNLGLYYSSIDSNDISRGHYHEVMKIGKEKGYKLYELSAMTNLALLEMEMGNSKTSDSLSTLALNLAKEELILYTVTPIYFGKTFYLMKHDKYEEALEMLDSARLYTKYAKQSEIPFLHLTYRCHEEMGDYENALFYYKQKVELQDSLDEVGNDKLLSELQFRYDDEKKERIRSLEKNKLKLQIKQNEIDIATYRQNAITLVSVFLIILFIIIILYFRLKQKSDNLFSHTIANKLEEERGRIARDLHDGLGQSLIVLKNNFNKLETKDAIKSEGLNTNFSEVIEQVRSISRSLIPPELRRLGLQKAIQSMMDDIEKSSDLIVTTEIENLSSLNFEEHQSIRIYRIVQELCTNTLKHSGATSVKLSAEKTNKYLMLVYQDNGKGLDLDKWKAANNSVGFKSIEQRLQYLKGTAKVDKAKAGFKIVFKIPMT